MQIHVHERGDVEAFVEPVAPPFRQGMAVVRRAEDVGMHFLPRRVGDFGDDGGHVAIRPVETVEKADRVEAVAEVAQVGQQPDGAVRPFPGTPFHQIADGGVQRFPGIAHGMVAPAENGQVKPLPGPAGMQGKDGFQLGQIQIHQEQPVLERVLHRTEPPVPDGSGVDGAVEVHGRALPDPMAGRRGAERTLLAILGAKLFTCPISGFGSKI